MDHGNTKFPRLDSPLLYKSLFINTFLSEDIVKNSLSKEIQDFSRVWWGQLVSWDYRNNGECPPYVAI